MLKFIWLACRYLKWGKSDSPAHALLDVALALQAGVTHAVCGQWPENWLTANIDQQEKDMAALVSAWIRSTKWWQGYVARARTTLVPKGTLFAEEDLYLHDRIPALFGRPEGDAPTIKMKM